ncbi:unnamed protein product [Closterium sp. NIES-64]|nr:unnamed protein product [Closterium sp. NIES-64]
MRIRSTAFPVEDFVLTSTCFLLRGPAQCACYAAVMGAVVLWWCGASGAVVGEGAVGVRVANQAHQACCVNECSMHLVSNTQSIMLCQQVSLSNLSSLLSPITFRPAPLHVQLPLRVRLWSHNHRKKSQGRGVGEGQPQEGAEVRQQEVGEGQEHEGAEGQQQEGAEGHRQGMDKGGGGVESEAWRVEEPESTRKVVEDANSGRGAPPFLLLLSAPFLLPSCFFFLLRSSSLPASSFCSVPPPFLLLLSAPFLLPSCFFLLSAPFFLPSCFFLLSAPFLPSLSFPSIAALEKNKRAREEKGRAVEEGGRAGEEGGRAGQEERRAEEEEGRAEQERGERRKRREETGGKRGGESRNEKGCSDPISMPYYSFSAYQYCL